MRNKLLIGFLLLSITGFALGASNTLSNTIIELTGLPIGTLWSANVEGFNSLNSSFVYTQASTTSNQILFGTLNSTFYGGGTHQVSIQVNTNNSIFQGSIIIPANPQYRGVTYALNTIKAGCLTTQQFTYNAINNVCMFAFLNLTQWYKQQANSLIAQGVSSNSAIINALNQQALNALLSDNSTGTNTVADRIIVTNTIANVSYGNLKAVSGYPQAGNVVKYAMFNNSTGILNIFTTNIIKNQSYICLNLSSTLFSKSFCNSGTYKLPIQNIGGHFGIGGPSTISITAKLQSSLIGTQNEQFNALIQSGSTTIFLSNSNTLNVFSLTKTFTYKAGDSLNITLDGLGNSNYSLEDPSVVAPTNILYYLPINVMNQNSVGVTMNTPIAIGVTARQFNLGNVIGFDATNTLWNKYETCDLRNVEFFGAGGSIIPSWLEGNMMSETTANSACTGSGSTTTSPNALALSQNVLWWVLIQNSTFLSANTGTPSSNTIYMGWAGNIPTANNNLLSNTLVGEAPQLGCNTPSNTISGCGSGTTSYGYYDDGAYVFNTPSTFVITGNTLYANFSGSSTPAGFQTNGVTNQNNGIFLGPASYILTNAQYGLSKNQIVDVGLTTSTSATQTSNRQGLVGYIASGSYPLGDGTHFTIGWGWGGASGANTKMDEKNSGGGVNPHTVGANKFSVFSTYWYQSTTSNFLYNAMYEDTVSLSTTVTILEPIGVWQAQSNGNGGTMVTPIVQWIRERLAPPNDILPNTTYGTVVSTATTNTPTLIATPNPFQESNTVIDVGQYATLNTIISNGVAPYSGNWAWTPPNTLLKINPSNTINNGILTNAINNAKITFNGYASTNAVLTFGGTQYLANALGTNTLTGVWTFTFGGFDSGTNTIVTNTNTVTLNPALVAGAPSESNTIIDLLQFVVQTSHPSGGTPAYTYQWYSNTIQAPLCDATNTIGGATSSTYVTQPLVTTNYAYKVTDSATTANSMCSTSDITTVYPAPVATLTFSNTLLDSGQTQNALISITGGIGPFTANLVNNTGAGWLTPKANVIITGNSAGTNSITFVVSTPAGQNSNSFTMNYVFDDTGDTTNDLFNSIQVTFTVNAAFNTLSISTPSPTTQGTGNTLTWTTSFTGGTSSFTYNWNVYNSITNVILFNSLFSNSFRGNTLSWTVPASIAGNTINANIIITDSATTNVVVNSILSGIITIVSPMNTCTFVTSNAAINFGTIPQGTNTIGTDFSGGYNVITITNTGLSTSNILTSGSNWNFNANSFFVTNTVWSSLASNNLWNPQSSNSKTGTANVEVQLSGSSVDTLQFTSNAITTNSLWFGASVPSNQKGSGSSTYAQTINIISSC